MSDRLRKTALPALALLPGCFGACWVAGADGFWLWLLGVTSAVLARLAWRADA